MRFDREERHIQVARDAAISPPAPSSLAALVLQLQQGVGNAVVARALATKLSAQELVRDLYHALEAGEWQAALIALASLPDDYAPKVVADLGSEDRRWLLDTLRLNQDLSEFSRLDALISKREKLSPGGRFGKVRLSQRPFDKGRGRPSWEFHVDIWFAPDPGHVVATEIAFVQTTRMTDTKTKQNREYQFPMSKRQNERGDAIDRPKGKDSGFYGYGNDDKPEPLEASAKPAFTVQPGSSPDPLQEAWMMDKVIDTLDDVSYEFETLIVAKQGEQEGLTYAAVHWGFDVDDKGHLSPHTPQLADMPSAGFDTAVEAYNAQASGAKKASPNQKPLPGFW